MTTLPTGISIILATHNRANALRETLASLVQVQPPSLPWEVILVNNASSDDTAGVIAGFSDRLPVVAHYEPRLGKSVALNSAIPRARYELLLFTDDDVLFDTQWLLAYERALAQHPDAGYYGGPIHLHLPGDGQIPPWAQGADGHMAVWIRNSLSYLDETILKESPASFYGANWGVKKTALDLHGSYHEKMGYIGAMRSGGMETELQGRLAAAGVRAVYVLDALVWHRIRPDEMTLRSRLHSRIWVGRSRAKRNLLAGTQRRLNPRRTLGMVRYALATVLRWPVLAPHERLARRSELCRRWGYEQQMWELLFDRSLTQG